MTRWTLSHIDVTLTTVTSMTVKDDCEEKHNNACNEANLGFAFATPSLKMLNVLK